MKLIKPSYEILDQKPGLKGIYEQIELAGRTCYKSKRPEGQTAKDFVDRMIASKHYAMLEHGTVYLLLTECAYDRISQDRIKKYQQNCYSKVIGIGCDDDNLGDASKDEFIYRGDTLGCGVYGNYIYAVTTNYRVLVENGWLDDLKYLYGPTEFHEKRVTVRFTSNIHFYKDITRHRRMSFAIESTRYCNYLKGKFGNELTFIIPVWMESEEKSTDTTQGFGINPGEEFFAYLAKAERGYIALLESGWQAQQAAEILPQATKADIVMTGFVSDWNYVFDLRARGTTGAPHPEVKRLMEPLMHEFEEKWWIK